MQRPQIGFYYGNVMADAIGPGHGITAKKLKALEKQTSPLIDFLIKERKAGKTPYRDLPYDKEIPHKVKELKTKFKGRCENLVVLGIGGSALGIIALQTALKPYMHNIREKNRTGPRLFVFDNVDPSQFASFLRWIGDRLEKTVFHVISRGGQTAETICQFMIIRSLLLRKFGRKRYKERVVITTAFGEDNTLLNIANEEGLYCLRIPDGVGGRFSVLSAVGLFSAVMCEIDIDSLLAGARTMDKKVSRKDFYKNPAAINAAINYHFYKRGKRITAMMPYSYALKDLTDWFKQLWAESLGKARDLDGRVVHIGPTPIKALGATDQHSQVQLYREGPNDKLFTFLQVNSFDRDPKMGPAPRATPELAFLAGNNLSTLLNNEKKATEYALLLDKRPCITIVFPEISAYTVGQFIYLYEVTTSFAGALFNINPYDQPAVELGKHATFALKGKPGYYKPGLTYKKWAKEIRSRTKIDKNFLV